MPARGKSWLKVQMYQVGGVGDLMATPGQAIAAVVPIRQSRTARLVQAAQAQAEEERRKRLEYEQAVVHLAPLVGRRAELPPQDFVDAYRDAKGYSGRFFGVRLANGRTVTFDTHAIRARHRTASEVWLELAPDLT